MAQVAPKGVADRVNLGLIPSSEDSWKAACRCLKAESGGWLHIHGNVNLHSKGAEKADSRTAKEGWLFSVVDSIKRIFSDFSTMSKWTVHGQTPRKVKSYGPHIWHMVADIQCRPADQSNVPVPETTVYYEQVETN
jgi:tRNA G37 N-methylase Trm5